MLRNGAPLGHLSHQRKWGSREKRSHNFWPFSPHGRLLLIKQTEGPQLGKERGLSWPYLSFGLSLDKTGQNRWTSNNRCRRRYAIALWKAIRQYGHKIWFDQPTHAHGVPSLPMRKTPTGLQHGTSCMIRSLRFPIPNGGRGHLGTKYSWVQNMNKIAWNNVTYKLWNCHWTQHEFSDSLFKCHGAQLSLLLWSTLSLTQSQCPHHILWMEVQYAPPQTTHFLCSS